MSEERGKSTNQPLKRPRLFQMLYAEWRNYFWLACPICGRPFGGHEVGVYSWQAKDGHGLGVCSECSDEARRRNLTGFRPVSERGEFRSAMSGAIPGYQEVRHE